MLQEGPLYLRNIAKVILQWSHAELLAFVNGILADVLTLLLTSLLREYALQKVMWGEGRNNEGWTNMMRETQKLLSLPLV